MDQKVHFCRNLSASHIELKNNGSRHSNGCNAIFKGQKSFEIDIKLSLMVILIQLAKFFTLKIVKLMHCQCGGCKITTHLFRVLE